MSGAKLRKLMLLQAVLFALLLATSATFVLLAYVFYDYPGVWEDLMLVIVMRLAILDHYLLMGSGALCTLSYILQWWTEAQKEATDES